MKTRKILSMLLSLVMVLGLMTPAAMAEDSVVVKNETRELTYSSFKEAVVDVREGETLVLQQDVTISNADFSLYGITLDFNGCQMTIENKSGLSLGNGVVIDANIVGEGTTIFEETVSFDGTNIVHSGIDGSPFELVVNKGATLDISRFVLGYDRAITVYGEIEDATNYVPASGETPSLKFNSTSGVSVGGFGTGKLTVKDAYVELGSSSWKNATGAHTWSFKNSYVSATSFTNCNPPGSDSASWVVTFDDSVLAAKNYIKNGFATTYSFINGSVATTGSLRIDGELNIDATSSVTTTAQQNNKVGAVDEHGGINGTVNVAGDLVIGSNAKTQLEVLGGTLNVAEGADVVLGDHTLTLDADSNLASAGNIDGAIAAAEGANAAITGGSYTHESAKEFIVPGSSAVVDGETVEVIKAAMIGETVYGSLQTAVNKAKDGDTIVLLQDIEQADGVLITDKKLTIDLNDKTFTVTEGASTNSRNFKVNGASEVTIENGTLVADGDMTSGAYGTVRTEDTANVTLNDLKLYSYRGYGLNVKANAGTNIDIIDTEIYAQYGGGVEAAGGTIELTDVKIEQTGVDSSAAWCSVAIGVNGGGEVIVNSGTYSAAPIATDSNAAQGTWVAYVMSSGGTLTINGGTFNGTVAETAAAANACGVICADRAAVVEIKGGTFNSNGAILDMRNNVGTLPNPVAALKGGTFSADPRVSGLYSSNLITVPEFFEVIENDNGTFRVADKRVAVVDGVDYGDLETALKAIQSGSTFELMNDVTITQKWDARNTGAKITVPVTINGNGHTLKFTNVVNDGFNHLAAFRFEAAAEVNDLTIDMSEAISEFNGRFRAISSSADLTVDGCTFIGSTAYTNTRAIIFGEGAGTNAANVEVSVTDCVFKDWSRGVGDNENAQDMKSVTVTGNTFTNADVSISAAETLTFSDNTMNNGGVAITSYTTPAKLAVTATGNTLSADKVNTIQAGFSFNVQEEFTFVDKDGKEFTPVAQVGETKYVDLQTAINAAQAGDSVKLITDVTAIVMPTADSTSNPANALVVLAKDDKITLDLNGYTISVTGDAEAKYDTLAIRNNGDLTITDTSAEKDGKITFTFSGTQENGSSQIHSTILNFGTLTVEAGTIENTATTGYGRYAIYSYAWGGNANVTVKGGTVTNNTGMAIYADGYSDFGTNSCNVTIEDGVLNGGVWYNGRTTTDGKNIAISGGTFNGGTNGALTIRSVPNTASVTGGTFNGAVSITEGVKPVTGGTFSVDPTAYLVERYMAVTEGGMYRVIPAAAKIGTVLYATLQDAVDAVKDNETIVLLFDNAETAVVNRELIFTLSPNGNAFTGSINAGSGVSKFQAGDWYTFGFGDGTSGGPGSSSSAGSTTPEKNPDGSTTTTTTAPSGAVTETTKYPDGSTTTVVTQKDGTVTETSKAADGTTSTIETDEDGVVTEVTVTVPAAAVNEAAKNDEPVTLPIEVQAVTDSEDAAEIDVNVPAKGATVEIPVEDVTPGTVVVIVNKDGSETIVPTTTLTENGVVVTLEDDATIKIIDNSKDFTDVPETYALADSIDFVSARGLFEGNTETTFNPHANTTVAQTMTVLARLDGEDFYGAGATTKGAEWAAENGLAEGITDVSAPVTRQQMVLMMWKLAGMPVSNHEIDHHTDAHEIDDHAIVAMQWAVEMGILKGNLDGSLDPHGNASRAHVAAFAERYVNAIV